MTPTTDQWLYIDQFIAIGAKGFLICLIISQLSEMKYPIYYTVVNYIKYRIQVLLNVFYIRHSLPDYELLEGYEYMQENKQYKWVILVLISQVPGILALMEDMHTGNFRTRSPWWNVSSPAQSISVAIAFLYLFGMIKRLHNEVKLYRNFIHGPEGLVSKGKIGSAALQ